MEEMQKLTKEKEVIESKIKDLTEVLNKNNVGMGDSLIDLEGYPRNDIDIYEVRHARHDIICLQNDYKSLMKKIEDKLIYIHQNPDLVSAHRNGTNVDVNMEHLTPFALINRVDKGSPAELDGVREGDLVCKFGSILSDNFRGLQDVAGIVKNSVNSPIQLVVDRCGNEKVITLTPRNWTGKGFLGCNIVPHDNLDR